MVMNRTLAIIALVVLAIILVILIRIVAPALKNFIVNLPKGIFIVLFLLIISMMIYLIVGLVSTDASNIGGNLSDDETAIVSDEEVKNEDIIAEKIENCIILEGNEIRIDNQIVDEEYLDEYLNQHVENNVEVVIVDNYSLAELHHRVTEICERKGVRYITEDETWIEQ